MGVKDILQREVRTLMTEAPDDDEYVPPKPTRRQEFSDTISGMMRDASEDSPDDFSFDDDHISQLRSALFKKSDEKVRPGWSSIDLKKKKKDVEFFDQPGYVPEPVGTKHGDYGYPSQWEEIAKDPEVEDLKSTSSVKQFVEDPRKLNLMDKLTYLLMVPEKERNQIMIGAAADFLDELEGGKKNLVYSPKDPGIQTVLKSYVDDLEAEGVLDTGDADALRTRVEFVVELDSFKKYAVDYFDDNFKVLLKYRPFREHLRKYWQELLRSDPDLMHDVEQRAAADIARVQADKAKKKEK